MLALVLFVLTFLLCMKANMSLYSVCVELANREIEINYLLIGWNSGKYMKMYKEITIEETGKTGRLYYLAYGCGVSTIVSFIAALICL